MNFIECSFCNIKYCSVYLIMIFWCFHFMVAPSYRKLSVTVILYLFSFSNMKDSLIELMICIKSLCKHVARPWKWRVIWAQPCIQWCTDFPYIYIQKCFNLMFLCSYQQWNIRGAENSSTLVRSRECRTMMWTQKWS